MGFGLRGVGRVVLLVLLAAGDGTAVPGDGVSSWFSEDSVAIRIRGRGRDVERELDDVLRQRAARALVLPRLGTAHAAQSGL